MTRKHLFVGLLVVLVAAALTFVAAAQAEIWFGTSGDDYHVGTAISDNLSGLNGRDTVKGAEGPDYVYGDEEGAGPGDLGDDLYGGGGNDQLQGNDGADNLHGDGGCNVVKGGDGNDEVRAVNGNVCDWLYGGPGFNECYGDWDVSAELHDYMDPTCDVKHWTFIN